MSPDEQTSLNLAVARRLEALRRLYVPETHLQARERLARERPSPVLAFSVAAAARLRELRALCDLAQHLRRRLRPPAGGSE